MTLRRYQDWPSRLFRFLADSDALPFVWGTCDCALWACDWIREATGEDPAARLRGTYATPEGAVLACKHFADGGDLEQVIERIAAALGQEEVPVAFAQRGDIGLATIDGNPCMGICAGAAFAFKAPHGVVYLPPIRVDRAWRL